MKKKKERLKEKVIMKKRLWEEKAKIGRRNTPERQGKRAFGKRKRG